MTIVTHSSEGKRFPPQVKIAVTDFSPQSLQQALSGQDVVLCVLGHAVLDRQVDVMHVAEKAGVKRFIPSDFGVPKGPNDVPEYRAILGKKAQALNLFLKEKAEKNGNFTWTSFFNGPLLDRVSIVLSLSSWSPLSSLLLLSCLVVSDFPVVPIQPNSKLRVDLVANLLLSHWRCSQTLVLTSNSTRLLSTTQAMKPSLR